MKRLVRHWKPAVFCGDTNRDQKAGPNLHTQVHLQMPLPGHDQGCSDIDKQPVMVISAASALN